MSKMEGYYVYNNNNKNNNNNNMYINNNKMFYNADRKYVFKSNERVEIN